MKFGVVVFPGSNCDSDCLYVIEHVLKQEVVSLWHKDTDLKECDCIIVPGGFSYGDYLRCGAIARFSPIMKSLFEFARKGGLIIGICNGFQILLESEMIKGALIRNRDLHFICKYVYLRVENNKTPFTSKFEKGQVIHVPIAHGEGNYHADEEYLNELEQNKQVIFRYCDKDGNLGIENNPNGSKNNIAGICNKEGNILGMMPHPERCAEPLMLGNDGILIFESLLSYKN
jgi:phosphoribosylformylglycinamidine synthase subunit PurQ / glutaminase